MKPFPITLWSSLPRHGVIDSYITNLWGAYGLVVLLTAYTGNCLRVRRSSDNTEQDIGFFGNNVNIASMLAFVGANDGFVSKWYDQSGGTNDLVQATTTKQPQIVDAGVYTYELLFDGSNDTLATTNNSGTPTVFTFYMAGRDRSLIQGINLSEAISYLHSEAIIDQVRFTVDAINYRINMSTSTGVAGYGIAPYLNSVMTKDNTTYAFQHNRSAGSIAVQNLMYASAVQQGESGTSGVLAISTFPAGPWYLGADSSGAKCARSAWQCALVYEAEHVVSGKLPLISPLIAPTIRTDVLDAYTTNLWGVYSLRRQRSNYAGSCLRVRRASDSTEQDIGFTASKIIDSAAIATFCTGTNGFVTKWYDQSGGGNNFAQTVAASQPKIYDSSTGYLGLLSFDGSNDWLTTINNSGTPTAFTMFLQVIVRSITDTVLLEHTTNVNTNNACMIEPGVAANQIGVDVHGTAGGGGFATSKFNMNIVGQVFCASVNRANVTGATVSRGFNGGALMTRDGNDDTGTLPSGAFASGSWSLGGRSGGTATTSVDGIGIVIYETAVFDANIERISRLLG